MRLFACVYTLYMCEVVCVVCLADKFERLDKSQNLLPTENISVGLINWLHCSTVVDSVIIWYRQLGNNLVPFKIEE